MLTDFNMVAFDKKLAFVVQCKNYEMCMPGHLGRTCIVGFVLCSAQI